MTKKRVIKTKGQDTEIADYYDSVAEKELPLRIRWLVKQDIPRVLQIEEESFAESWSQVVLCSCLAKRNHIGLVAELKGQVVGYALYEVMRRRIELVRIAVDSGARRMRVATRLTHKLISKLSATGRFRLLTTIPERNLTAQLFFRFMKFRATTVIKKHDSINGDDAYVMQFTEELQSPNG